jgi:D-glycero-alpha-D-manno-heptose-7-phosphate kinase
MRASAISSGRPRRGRGLPHRNRCSQGADRQAGPVCVRFRRAQPVRSPQRRQDDGQRIFLAADTVQRLEASLFLFYLGGSRSASSILKEQTSNLDQTKIFETQKAMVCQVDVGIKLLQDGDLDGFGRLLHEAWLVKKTLASKIFSDVIDAYYQKGLEAGALGGKLAGAGGGGFLLFYCPPRARQFFLAAMSELRRIPLCLEFNGSRVIHVSDE